MSTDRRASDDTASDVENRKVLSLCCAVLSPAIRSSTLLVFTSITSARAWCRLYVYL